MSTTEPQPGPTHMTLPPELRLQIFAHILLSLEGAALMKEPPLLHTCRQLRAELLWPYLTAVTQDLDRTRQEIQVVLDRMMRVSEDFDNLNEDEIDLAMREVDELTVVFRRARGPKLGRMQRDGERVLVQ